MNALKLLREATQLAHHLKNEGGLTFDDLFPDMDNTDEIASLYLTADEWRKTASLVEKVIAARLEALLDGRSVEVGGTLLWRGETKRERCIDSEGFWAWLATQDTTTVQKVFNENSARKGAIPPAVRDTFFEKQSTGKVELQQAPIEVIEDNKRKRERNE